MGEVFAGAGIARRDRLLHQVRADAVSRCAALPGGRLWLHDVHRQLGAAADGRQQVHRRPWAGRGVGALGQSQLRGAYLAGGSRELSDESAAGGPYALAGHISHNFERNPLGKGKNGQPVYLRDIWPSQAEVAATVPDRSTRRCSTRSTRPSPTATRTGAAQVPEGDTYGWEPNSTYIRKAPYFDGMQATPTPVEDIVGARVLAVLGDSVTTGNISPAGSINSTARQEVPHRQRREACRLQQLR